MSIGYIYPEGISAERKPERLDFKQPGNFYYQTALKEFEDNLIPIKNHVAIMHPHYWIKIARKVSLRFTPGTKVEHNNGTVTKIL